MTRDEIENRGQCDWITIKCPECESIMSAYQGTIGDYVLLCNTYTCMNWFRAAHIFDMQDEIYSNDWESIVHR
jgi:hypothetical protein